MGFVYNQSPRELVYTVMQITVASGVILLILLSLGKRTAPGMLDIGYTVYLKAKSVPICMMLAPVL